MRRLRRSKGRSRRPEDADRLLLEGPHLLAAALGSGVDVEQILASPQWRVPSWLTDNPAAQRLVRVEPALLEELADADSPRGVIALGRLAEEEAELLQSTAQRSSVLVFLDRIADPANLGAVARVAEGAGAAALVLSPASVSWRHPRALRASAGSLLRLPVYSQLDAADLENLLGSGEWSWCGLIPSGGDDLFRCELPPRVVLAIGSESHGLTPDTEARLGRRLTIPTDGALESLNLATAAAVALFELRRRRTT